MHKKLCFILLTKYHHELINRKSYIWSLKKIEKILSYVQHGALTTKLERGKKFAPFLSNLLMEKTSKLNFCTLMVSTLNYETSQSFGDVVNMSLS